MSPRKKTNKFDKFRDRAIAVAGEKSTPVNNEPYVLGEEYNIEPAIEIKKPSLKTRVAIENAAQNNQITRTLALMMGNENLNRVLDIVSEYENETGEDGDLILLGIFIDLTEHFFGKGSALDSFMQQ